MKKMWMIATIAALVAAASVTRDAALYGAASLDPEHHWLTVEQVLAAGDADAGTPTLDSAYYPVSGLIPQAAIYIPEPATLGILGIGAIALRRRKK